ncbi:SRPBCC domain-containing protein [Streptomyces sp. b94]|nr:SRPBCC domain-containing protein [Streptomyces sp. b94]
MVVGRAASGAGARRGGDRRGGRRRRLGAERAAGALWGPPTYPATVEEHDLAPGGDVTYFMTGPEGDKHRGWWRIASVDAPTTLEFTDGFADADGTPSADMPTTTTRVTLTERDGGTRMEMRSAFDTREQMDQLAEMGMEDGLREAVGQMDGLLAG